MRKITFHSDRTRPIRKRAINKGSFFRLKIDLKTNYVIYVRG